MHIVIIIMKSFLLLIMMISLNAVARQHQMQKFVSNLCIRLAKGSFEISELADFSYNCFWPEVKFGAVSTVKALFVDIR